MISQNQTKRDCSFTIWYIIVVTAFMVLSHIDKVREYFIWLKPIPVLLLIIQLHSVRQTHKPVRWIETGLCFGMIGDILIEINGPETYFYIGTSAFFLGHICYSVAFFSTVQLLQVQTSTRSSVFFTVVYAVIIAGGMMTNLHYIFKYIDTPDKISLSVYLSCLSFMTVAAFYLSLKARYDHNLKFASVAIFLGGFIFMLSDVTMSEMNQNDNIDSNSKQIMSYVVGITYWLGQFLIAQGGFKISTVPKDSFTIQKSDNAINGHSQSLVETLVSQE